MESPDRDSTPDLSPESAEVCNLQCKLESKSKALVILSQDLVEVKRERDEYKLMAEQIRDRYQSLKKRIKSFGPNISSLSLGDQTHHSLVQQIASNTPLSHVLLDLTEQNKYLLFEVEDLKTKLMDAEGDLKLMREQMRANSHYNSDLVMMAASSSPSFAENNLYRNQRTMEEVVAQLETFRNRVSLMEQDLQSILDEKEDLILSRDSYKRKTERLNHKLNELMRRRASCEDRVVPHVDIDSLEAENLFLKEKLRQMEDEKKLNELMLTKYKSMLEQTQNKRTLLSSFGLNYGNNGTTGGTVASVRTATVADHSLIPTTVISSRQIQQFIASNGLNHLEVSGASITRLRSLVLALFESLCDKSSALTLHKKNNKLLGKRITELEERMRLLNTEKVLLLTKGDDDSFPRLEDEDESQSEEKTVTPVSCDSESLDVSDETDTGLAFH